MKIKVQIKNVYGQPRIYPACDTAKKFLRLTGGKTFSKQDIELIKQLGYVVEVAPSI